MSKNKTLTIQFEDQAAFTARVTKALKSKAVSIEDKQVLTFSSVAEYFKFMSEQKLTILAVIAGKKPRSIYQLADLVDRDFANVQRDCVGLAAHGFISLEVTDKAKKSKAPRLAFDYSRIVIRMPQVTYSHHFGDAA